MRYSLNSRSTRGFSLIELSVTIAVILILAGIVTISVKPFVAYRDGTAAGEMLRSVKAAELMYLADYPATAITALTQDELLHYMPQGKWPTLPSVNGQTPTIDFNNYFPPVAVLNGNRYDPSGSYTDGLWDVGQY
jgi:prepilin-type N-terminal cleavage/methylation domain-containing protein